MVGKGPTGYRHLIVAATLILAAACSNKPPDDPEQYAARLTSERAAKDAEFRRNDDVVPKDKKDKFLPLYE